MAALHYDDAFIAGILTTAKTIAMVGASPDPARASHGVMQFLQAKGHRVIPVNPRAGVATILGETVYPDLASIPQRFDMVDVFRNSADAGPVIDETIAIVRDKGVTSVWLQLGVRNDEAAARAQAAGLKVVMDRCPAIEYRRLSGARSA